MNKSTFLPLIIILFQIISSIHLYYSYRYNNSHIPVALIELNILAIVNLIILIISYFFYFKVENKESLWLIPISLAGLIILILVIVYIIMFAYKYK